MSIDGRHKISNVCNELFAAQQKKFSVLLHKNRERFWNDTQDLAQETATYQNLFSDEDQGRTVAELEESSTWDCIHQEFIYYLRRFLYYLLHLGVSEEELLNNLQIRLEATLDAITANTNR